MTLYNVVKCFENDAVVDLINDYVKKTYFVKN